MTAFFVGANFVTVVGVPSDISESGAAAKRLEFPLL